MKSRQKIIKRYTKDRLVIVVAEDIQYIQKLEADFEVSIDLLIIYTGRRIVSLKNNSVSIFSLLNKPKVVVSEYFNAVPRFFGILFGANTLSIVYGVLNISNFQKRRSFLRKLREPLYADNYLVINRRATFNALESVHNENVKFVPILRNIGEVIPKENYSLWISQCWEEIGYNEIEVIQRECKSKLEARSKLLIVRHPRDADEKYSDVDSNLVIQCLSGVFDYVKLHGPPSMIYGFTSSALLELADYNLNVTRITSDVVEVISDSNQDLLKLNSVHIDEL